MLAALAEDHFNDVISNSVAMVTAAVAFHSPAWWIDPVGMLRRYDSFLYRFAKLLR
jgi:divalent metal cation (Fe/Co/Zn/Cd) transporter